ncbi:hypothetical protein PR001_g17471 [Phytophthora rubi]|uniref:Uncharacterized protein n=1 Tax=Phytophthora rubi TaxID=129364 RepID=A0A6A3KFN1_9STRA|nr:hypothetical protein PR001_g17471 [Phytophthora rubi]
MFASQDSELSRSQQSILEHVAQPKRVAGAVLHDVIHDELNVMFEAIAVVTANARTTRALPQPTSIYPMAVGCGRALDGGAQHWLAQDRVSHEQLKRIPEFGRVHGTVVREATYYVNNMEVQLKRQFEADCAGVRAQAPKFVAKTSADNEGLNRRVKKLEAQVKGLRKQNNVLKEEKTQTN